MKEPMTTVELLERNNIYLDQIAQKAGLSKFHVKSYLNDYKKPVKEETKQRIEDSIQELYKEMMIKRRNMLAR
jgi:hypothetical protein